MPCAKVSSSQGLRVKDNYDVRNKRRNADWRDASAPIVANETIRGYTGHETQNTVGLVHRHERLCDAKLGRMLPADPFVPGALNPQAFNRATGHGDCAALADSCASAAVALAA